MKVFTTVIFVTENKLGVQLLFPHEKISWAKPQRIFHGENTSWAPS